MLWIIISLFMVLAAGAENSAMAGGAAKLTDCDHILHRGAGRIGGSGLSSDVTDCDHRVMMMEIPAPRISLRSLAESRDVQIGAAVAAEPLLKDSLYGKVLGREFNTVVPKDAMKFRSLHGDEARYDFSEADALVDFANSNGMKVRGHTLVWEPVPSVSESLPRNRLPEWLTGKDWSREELVEVLREHISTVVGRYRGKVWAWDVVNEAVDETGALRENIWLRNIGPEYIEMAFRYAHEADPEARLFYNDYNGEGLGRKSDAVYALVKGLMDKGVPIDGVGLQMHVSVDRYPDPREVAANIRRLSGLGLEVHITEMDVRIEGAPTDDKLARQARIYREILEAGLSARNFKALVMWGFTDRYSWIPGYFEGWGSALIFDRSYSPKSAYSGLLLALSRAAQGEASGCLRS